MNVLQFGRLICEITFEITVNRKKKKYSQKCHTCQAGSQTLIIYTVASVPKSNFPKAYFSKTFFLRIIVDSVRKMKCILHVISNSWKSHFDWRRFFVSWVHNTEIWKSGYFKNKRYSIVVTWIIFTGIYYRAQERPFPLNFLKVFELMPLFLYYF